MFNKETDKKVSGTSSILAKLRRITAFDFFNSKNAMKIENLFFRFSKYMAEALWCNMYQRLYRSLTLNDERLNEAGRLVSHIKNTSNNRPHFIDKLQRDLQAILNKPKDNRSVDECSLIMAIMNMKNDLKGNLFYIINILILIFHVIIR